MPSLPARCTALVSCSLALTGCDFADGDEPAPLGRAALAERVAGMVTPDDPDARVDAVECDEDLPGEEDATVSCTARPAQGEGVVTAHVTDVDGLMVHFDHEVVR